MDFEESVRKRVEYRYHVVGKVWNFEEVAMRALRKGGWGKEVLAVAGS